MCRKKIRTRRESNIAYFKEKQEDIAIQLERILGVFVTIKYVEKVKGIYISPKLPCEINKKYKKIIPNSTVVLGGIAGKGSRILVIFSFLISNLERSEIIKINKTIKPYCKVEYQDGKTHITISNNPAVFKI